MLTMRRGERAKVLRRNIWKLQVFKTVKQRMKISNKLLSTVKRKQAKKPNQDLRKKKKN